ncbi:MAG TPA: phosphate signaling complex protein PhoU [Fimbriimonadaceae bacterium]|nr:phosphate signaling complex protein PhoU [Fimbriimonadaceae bacterium]
MTLRQHFDDRLRELRSDVLRMGGVVAEMIRLGVEATISGDIGLASKVIEMDDEVDAFEKSVLKNTVLTMMQEAPVAGDLRVLVSILGVVGEIEKAADDAVKLARRSTKLTGHFPAELKLALNELGEETRTTFLAAMRLLGEYDEDLANQIVHGDKAIDTRYVAARDRVIDLMKGNPTEAEHLVRTIESFHALEHVADHAVEIAQRLKLHQSG